MDPMIIISLFGGEGGGEIGEGGGRRDLYRAADAAFAPSSAFTTSAVSSPWGPAWWDLLLRTRAVIWESGCKTAWKAGKGIFESWVCVCVGGGLGNISPFAWLSGTLLPAPSLWVDNNS